MSVDLELFETSGQNSEEIGDREDSINQTIIENTTTTIQPSERDNDTKINKPSESYGTMETDAEKESEEAKSNFFFFF